MPTPALSYSDRVRQHMVRYKTEVLGVTDSGCWNGRPYPHILPQASGECNLLLPAAAYRMDGIILHLPRIGQQIKLHRGWRHLNSSQILCVSYFYPFAADLLLLDRLVRFLGISARAGGARFEVVLPDSSNIDFVIDLVGGGHIYFEIKYTEPEFGTAASPTTDYAAQRARYHAAVAISDADYRAHYQMVRNIAPAHMDGSDYTVFLLPRENAPINASYDRGVAAIENCRQFRFQRVYWEDLLNVFPNAKIKEKYFDL